MRAHLPILITAALLLALPPGTATAAQPDSSAKPSRTVRSSIPIPIGPGDLGVLHSAASTSAKAAGDTFCIYGGPGSVEGKFQTTLFGGLPDKQGWTGRDDTQVFSHWQVSTFMAANLDPLPGNHAMWCGEDDPSWVSPPGYGNGWNDVLAFERPVADPSQPSDVRLSFVFNHDTEPGYDFFSVQWDSAGSVLTLDRYDNYNADNWGDPPITPVSFDRTVHYAGNDYAGQGNDRIRLLLRVTSDGAWSNEDGLWPSISGAVQADNIHVSVDGVEVSLATFEGVAGDEDWQPDLPPFVGDFFKVFARAAQLDPCRLDRTPVASFVDDGTPPNNAPGQSTGGSWSNTANTWVVNYTGGLSQGTKSLTNAAVSPEILWDDPTTTADDGLDSGAFLRFDMYDDFFVVNGIGWNWQVRSAGTDGIWDSWKNRGFVYISSSGPHWRSVQLEIRDLLVPSPEKIQIGLQVFDLADLFAFPGLDATPAPYYDNVTVCRYQHLGPMITTRSLSLFHDAFPTSGTLDTSDLAALAVRIDATLNLADLHGGQEIIPGDSLIVDVTAVVPGTTLIGPPTLQWVLEANPLFDAVRQLPIGSTLAGTSSRGWNLWQGTLTGMESTTPSGTVVPNRWFFDLPDGPARPQAPWQGNEPPLFLPGDVLRYAIFAEDSGGGRSQLPVDVSNLVSGDGYDRLFTVHALPSLLDDGGGGVRQPSILLWNDNGFQSYSNQIVLYPERRGQTHEYLQALKQNGLVEGSDFDVYVTRAPQSWLDNGLGAAPGHGATAAQIEGYSTLLYMGGSLRSLLSDGSDDPGQGTSLSDDIGLLTAWHDQPFERHAAYFADNIASSMKTPAQLSYLSTVMGVALNDDDVKDEISGELAPTVIANPDGSALGFDAGQPFTAYGGCLGLNRFDSISPAGAAIATHAFMVDGITQSTGPAAAIHFGRQSAGQAKVDLSFPYGLAYVYDPREPDPAQGGISGRAELMREILTVFGHDLTGLLPTPNPAAVPSRLSVEGNTPNPFNPVTTLRFSTPARGRVKAAVYNLRGERVRSLLDAEVAAGSHALTWNGTDGQGQAVASGIYFYRIEGFGQIERGKMALVK